MLLLRGTQKREREKERKKELFLPSLAAPGRKKTANNGET
jgi:hypothetical protein